MRGQRLGCGASSGRERAVAVEVLRLVLLVRHFDRRQHLRRERLLRRDDRALIEARAFRRLDFVGGSSASAVRFGSRGAFTSTSPTFVPSFSSCSSVSGVAVGGAVIA